MKSSGYERKNRIENKMIYVIKHQSYFADDYLNKLNKEEKKFLADFIKTEFHANYSALKKNGYSKEMIKKLNRNRYIRNSDIMVKLQRSGLYESCGLMPDPEVIVNGIIALDSYRKDVAEKKYTKGQKVVINIQKHSLNKREAEIVKYCHLRKKYLVKSTVDNIEAYLFHYEFRPHKIRSVK